MNDNVIVVNGQDVHLDPNNMKFDEATLTEYLQKEAGFYNNFGAYLAKAEFIQKKRELEYDCMWAETFKHIKETQGGSDTLCQARTDSDANVQAHKEKALAAQLNVRLLQQHLRAWDKNHENAQSLGHYLRKEMDKLNLDIKRRYDSIDDVITPYESQM